MSLTVTHLNSDASFLLSFQPLPSCPPSPGRPATSFNVVLDPWLSGSAKIFHAKFSLTRHKSDACVASLTDIPDVDLVVISQAKSDHCHKETLTQLPPRGGKTLILAEPGAAKIIRSWKHFAPEKVMTLPRFEEPRPGKPSATHRVPIPSASGHGRPGEITITFLAQKADLTRLHSAIGITYRAPSNHPNHPNPELTPPATPTSSSSPAPRDDRALSVIHAPHGITWKTLQPYAATHLRPHAAFPVTALLHCFDRIQNAWYLGGNICSGLPGGIEVARQLQAQVWISAHDGEKDVQGLANRNLVVQKFGRAAVEKEVSPRADTFARSRGTAAVVLGVGEEVHLGSHQPASGYGTDSDSDQHGHVDAFRYAHVLSALATRSIEHLRLGRAPRMPRTEAPALAKVHSA
ncbi:hypothetical protein QTJ16_002718 [Diplocarpon rosae]|uniref:Uncharacterized protein n=1 Tax=Diplocarpon rosae TaxID=946125 RepID=A0AAD9T3Q0_9HELO|nr:hypothetical protein QTJ16_002718 [Diplocarpon rosae]PBP19603.1 hypothetical protein BUE80_DR009578 [Diplocarpon rosae]